MELFEIIRKDYHHHDKSIRQIAKERHIHRRMVRQALQNAVPPSRKSVDRQATVLTPTFRLIIEQWVLDDLKAPRKQRHTGTRVYERLRDEHYYAGSLMTVRAYFYKVRKQLGRPKQAFVPQCYRSGEEAEVDWYEAQVDFPAGRQKIFIFQMRACYSGKEFHRAYFKQNQQSFLDGHVAAFNYFGGVFKTIRYDNLTSAVKKVLRGRKRVETEKFIALHSHYLFDAQFCLPGIKGAHEKGGVECGVGRFRRAHLVPVPSIEDLDELNQRLLAACYKDEERRIHGQTESVRIRWQQEQHKLQSLPNDEFDTADVLSPVVNNKSLVSVKDNYYSVPVEFVGQTIESRVTAQQVRLIKQGKCIATYPRSYLRHQQVVQLEHYLPLLKYKPGALSGSIALAQARQQGVWPSMYDRYWAALKEQMEPHHANQTIVDFLWWARDYPIKDTITCLEQVIDSGALGLESIQICMRRHLNPTPTPHPLPAEQLGALQFYHRAPSTTLTQYDSLIPHSIGA